MIGLQALYGRLDVSTLLIYIYIYIFAVEPILQLSRSFDKVVWYHH